MTVNLAPADIRKEGTHFDLPIAIGILTASGIVPQEKLKNHLLVGELSLDGRVRPVPGVYYNRDRCHLSLNKDAPLLRPAQGRASEKSVLTAVPKVGGLHHRYEWRAAA